MWTLDGLVAHQPRQVLMLQQEVVQGIQKRENKWDEQLNIYRRGLNS
jgi:hypothetical protein